MRVALTALSIVASTAAPAFPEGAPWGAADPAAPANCATCHFDYDPVRDAAAVSVEGLPMKAAGGESYRLVIRFAQDGAVAAGFQAIAVAEGGSAGWFSGDSAETEYAGPAVRSTAPSGAGNGAAWALTWTAPAESAHSIVIHVAVLAANDDGSPFGDVPYFRSFTVRM